MSNFFLADRIKEYSRVQGTTSIVLDGSAPGFSSFSDFYASGDTVFYAITDNSDYEVGSGTYKQVGLDRVITRNPFRSSRINSGPWYVNGTSSQDSSNGYFYPLWLTKSAALSGVGFNSGPFTSVSGVSFDEVPGQTFYYITEHAALAVNKLAGSGKNFYDGSKISYSSGQPIPFGVGLKEVFVTYPGKTAVFNGFGVDSNFEEPKVSGVAFWGNEQIINYSSDIVFDKDNARLGIARQDPSYRLDVGGDRSRSIVRASGFIEGGSGIYFSGGQLLPQMPTKTASGGIQLEPFYRNQLGNQAQGIIKLSGIVDQYIGFDKVPSGTVLIGPASGTCGADPCDPDYPSFRALEPSDIPDLGDSYVVQRNKGLDGASKNISPSLYTAGMVAIYASSGEITYDSGIYFDASNNRLLINGDAAVDLPLYELDVRGTVASQSGRLDQIIFTDQIIRIGQSAGNKYGNNDENFYTINIGSSAGSSASGQFDGTFIGRRAGQSNKVGSGIVAIGYYAGKEGIYIDESFFAGSFAGASVSGMANAVSIGLHSLEEAVNSSGLVVIGKYAGSGISYANSVIAIGDYVAQGGSGLENVVALGKKALLNSSGIYNSQVIGSEAVSGAYDISNTIAIGNQAAMLSSGVQSSIAIGDSALESSQSVQRVAAFGDSAGSGSLLVFDSVFVGNNAGVGSSGANNVYIGTNAGFSVSGHQNIEIITSGFGGPRLLTHEASGKINIGDTIVGDIYQSRVAIGAVDNTYPSGTLFVRPRNADEPAFIIQHQGSGSKTPYFALQSGDGVTFFSINNSGDIVTSGCVKASGGFCVPDIVPDNTSYKLYNDGGALYWDGALLDTAGTTTVKLANDTENSSAPGLSTFTNNQLITISGVSGVEVQQGPANGRFIRISASGLSGVLQRQIASQTFSFQTVASGYGNLNNNPFSQANTVGMANEVVLSGISGVNIDFKTLTDGGGNRSGIFIIGYDSNTTFTANLIASGESVGGGRNKSRQLLLTGSGLAFSGIKGVDFSFSQDTDPQASVFTLDPSVLSGVLYDTTIASGNYIWEDHIDWRASGIAVSGQVVANTNAIAGITQLSAVSGINVQDSKYVMDSGNGGQLSFLTLMDLKSDDGFYTHSSGNVLITSQSGVDRIPKRGANVSGIFIGPQVAISASGQARSIIIGGDAGTNSNGAGTTRSFDSNLTGRNVFIGFAAGKNCDNSSPTSWNSDAISNVFVGSYAGSNTEKISNTVAIGECLYGISAQKASNVYGGLILGDNAASLAKNFQYPIAIGFDSLSSSIGVQSDIAIGRRSLYLSRDVVQNVAIGAQSAYQASGLQRNVFIGYQAGSQVSGSLNTDTQTGSVVIGNQSCYQSKDIEASVMIGQQAGSLTSGVENSVLIGPYAGYKRGGGSSGGSLVTTKPHSRNCIIISNKSAAPATYDAPWSNKYDNYILDIGNAIQGRLGDVDQSANTVNLHIGQPLENHTLRSWSDLQESTLSLTPDDEYHHALRINQHSVGGASSYGLLTTEMSADRNNTGASVSNFIPDTLNEIISPRGFLRVPVGDSINTAGAFNEIVVDNGTAGGFTVSRNDGVISVIDDGTTRALAVCIGNTWYKVALTAL